MPTRLPVLLHRRKSADAGAANSRTSAQASEIIPAPRRVARGLTRAAANWAIRIITLRISRWFQPAVNEDGAEVIDVGEGGARAEEMAQAFEKAGGVVVGKKRGRIEAELLGARHGVALHIGAGGIVGRARPTIRAVGIARQCRDAGCPRKFDGERQRVFLIRSAAAPA